MNRIIQGGQQWGEKLIFHRKLMASEMKKNLKRLSFLAEERHIQYKQEFIEDRRKKIDANHQKMELEKAQIKKERAEKKQSLFLLDMGLEKARKEQAEQKAERKRLAKLKREKMEQITTKARREWLIEMNDKCMMWNKTPDEMQYAQYRLFNKAILSRLPRNRNLILDRHPEIQDAVEEFDQDGKKIDYTALLDQLKSELTSEGNDISQINNVYDPILVTAKETKAREEEEALAIEQAKEEVDQDNDDDFNDEDTALDLDKKEDDDVETTDKNNDSNVELEAKSTATTTTESSTPDLTLQPPVEESTPVVVSDEYDIGQDVIDRESSPSDNTDNVDINDNELAELEAEFLKELETLPTNKMINVLETELKEKFTDARKQEELEIVKQIFQDKKPSSIDNKIVDITSDSVNKDESK